MTLRWGHGAVDEPEEREPARGRADVGSRAVSPTASDGEPGVASALGALDPYPHLAEGPAVMALAGGEASWASIEGRAELHRGRLVSCFEQDAGWTAWELHPAGDEVVMVLGGSCTVYLHPDDGTAAPLDASDGATRSVPLADGRYVVVPKGTWHTMDVHVPGPLLAITWGQGTRHRPRVDPGGAL